MKRLTLIAFFSILFIQFSISQNYQSFRSDRTVLFEDYHGFIRAISFDSVKYEKDSVLYPFPNIRQLDYECFTPYGGSWIGKEIIISSSGMNYFVNKENDSIRFNTKAKSGESWIAYRRGDTFLVKAKVKNTEITDFLGLSDSVKTIEFQAYNGEMDEISHSINNRSIQISKNFGMIKTLNFFVFPDYEFYNYPSYNDNVMDYTLKGFTHPETGLQNIRWFDVYDFQPGDEIHSQYEKHYLNNNTYSTDIRKTIKTYLTRTNYRDSIVYSLDKITSLEIKQTDSASLTVSHDTVHLVVKRNALFDELPDKTLRSGDAVVISAMRADEFVWKDLTYAPFHFMNDSCLSHVVVDDCSGYNKYIPGFGGPYYRSESCFDLDYSLNKLVYYKKGDETWGTPLVITTRRELSRDAVISVEQMQGRKIRVILNQISLPVRFSLYSINGQNIQSKQINQMITYVNLPSGLRGLVLYKFECTGGDVATGKIWLQ